MASSWSVVSAERDCPFCAAPSPNGDFDHDRSCCQVSILKRRKTPFPSRPGGGCRTGRPPRYSALPGAPAACVAPQRRLDHAQHGIFGVSRLFVDEIHSGGQSDIHAPRHSQKFT